jgi:WhiB family redox-sensing transcriptional regulator
VGEYYVRPKGPIPDGGVCAETDPDLFFPDAGRTSRALKRLCKEVCDVREECLEGALARKEKYGIWGGLSESERKKLGKLAVS